MTLVKKPNFLIVGAAKAGSTTLYRYIKNHPQIFMSRRKEPLYFISEIVKHQNVDKWMRMAIKKNNNNKTYVDNFDDYLKLFEDVNDEVAIGEASATYLYYYKTSIPRIKKELGDVKILIILRNPLEKVFSQYKYLKREGAEPYSFPKAIQKEKKRIAKKYNSLYHYVSQGLYFKQVKAFFDNFNDVKVLLLEDLNKKTNKTMKSVFNFLSVDDSYRIQNNITYNKTGYIPKSKKINKFLNTKLLKTFRYIIKYRFPKFYDKAVKYFFHVNSISTEIYEKERSLLYDSLYKDILHLERYLNIDLSAWKNSFE